MKKRWLILSIAFVVAMVTSCGPSNEEIVKQTGTVESAIAKQTEAAQQTQTEVVVQAQTATAEFHEQQYEEIVEAAKKMCSSGERIPDTPNLPLTDPGPHPIVIVDTDQDEVVLPEEPDRQEGWFPESVEEGQYVVCIKRSLETIEKCEYTTEGSLNSLTTIGLDLLTYKHQRHVLSATIYKAYTAKSYSFSIKGDAPPFVECPEKREFSSDEEYNVGPKISTEKINSVLESVVKPYPFEITSSTVISPKDNMALVYIPEGEFLIGDPDDDRTTYLDEFWIDKVEVTNAMYMSCVKAGGCKAPPNRDKDAPFQTVLDPSYYYRENFIYGNYPVTEVSWNKANAYCKWAGRRLPTVAEWEKAARGTEGYINPWGNDPITGNLLNFADSSTDLDWANETINDGYEFAAPVGSYPDGASPYGALDMAGNVSEWVADWFDLTYEYHIPETNPTGPSSGTWRVIKGVDYTVEYSYVFGQIRGKPGSSWPYVGFRCATSDAP